MKMLSEKAFFYHAKCPHWLHRDLVHGKGLDQLEHLLIDDGLLSEVVEGVLRARGRYETVPDEDVDDAFSRTLTLMREGVQTIYRGVFVDGHWVARPDILERVEGHSELGDYYYIAVDAKRLHVPQQIRDTHKLQGALYAEMLARVQGTKPTSGYIMSPEGTVMRYDLEEFEAEYHLTLERIERIFGGQEPGHILTSGCKASPYFDMCVDDTEHRDDLSLLNRIHREEVEELNRLGVSTVMQLASSDADTLCRKVLDMSDARVHFLRRQAVALKERVHDVVEPVTFVASDVELHFDIESDPVRDLDYLFGVLKVERQKSGEVTENYHAFVAESPEEEQEAWDAFTAFLADHRYAPVYHYGWYEINVCAKLIERYGAPEQAIESWQNNFVDLNAALRPAVIFPLSFYSLKDIAQYIGFKWRSDDATGVNSIRWFHDWLETGNRALLQKIIQYNEDDVRATRLLKEWLEKQTPNSRL